MSARLQISLDDDENRRGPGLQDNNRFLPLLHRQLSRYKLKRRKRFRRHRLQIKRTNSRTNIRINIQRSDENSLPENVKTWRSVNSNWLRWSTSKGADSQQLKYILVLNIERTRSIFGQVQLVWHEEIYYSGNRKTATSWMFQLRYSEFLVMDCWLTLRKYSRQIVKNLLHLYLENPPSTLLKQKRQVKQSRHRKLHHVRGRPISFLPEKQLEFSENSRKKTFLIHERIIRRNNVNGLQCFPEDSKNNLRSIYFSSDIIARTICQINH